MTYKSAESMILTRNCYNLITSDAVEPIGFLKSKITYVNGCSSLIDLATGIATPISAYRQRKQNKRSDDPKEYVYTPVYFEDPDPEVTESLYRQGVLAHVCKCCKTAEHLDFIGLRAITD